VNEHPSDPATYSLTATVPAKWSVIANGVADTADLPAAAPGMKLSRWIQREPITSYESTIYIDTFTTTTRKTTDRKPIVSAFAPVKEAADYKVLDGKTSRILQVLSAHFGSYPFEAAGGIYTGLKVGFALETASRPVYPAQVDEDTVVHELTHQWFGDDVVINRWSDICLNECFASYGPWLWHQDVDGSDLDKVWLAQMKQVQDDPGFWSSPLVDMGAGNEFTSVYTRGPLAIHALRKQMGEKTFATLLKSWPAAYADKAASWNDFQAYVNKLSGQDLTGFMNAWFRATRIPPAKYLHPGGI
jgi:aminopeptidase N